MKVTIIVLFCLFVFCGVGLGEIYKWVDEKGTVHFTEDWERIPEKYRDQVKRKEMPEEPTPREDRIREQEMRDRSRREYEKIETDQTRREKIRKAKEAAEAERLDISVSYKGRDTGCHIFHLKVKNNGTKSKFVSYFDFMLVEEDNRSVSPDFPVSGYYIQRLGPSSVLPGGFVEGYIFFPALKRGKTLTYMVTGEEFSVR